MKKILKLLLVVLFIVILGCSSDGGGDGESTQLSSEKTITEYSLAGVAGTIDETGKTISVSMPYGTDETSLIASFVTTASSVEVGGIKQVSGATANSFTSPVTYTVKAADGSTQNYVVTVTIKQPYSATASIDKKILQPYLRSKSYGSLEEAKNIDKSKQDGLILGLIAFNLIIDYQDTGNDDYLITAKEYLDYLRYRFEAKYSNNNVFTWKYDYAWGALAPGWWSCMDNAINALAFKAGAEAFANPGYEQLYKKALNGLLLTVPEGGSVLWITPDSYWLSEYTWEGSTLANEYYVLNGYTFSLLALRIIASVTGDQNYATMYNYALNSYKNIYNQFYTPDGKWTYYMLSPKEIEPMHYAIFDALLLESLYEISHDQFFAIELAQRRQLIKNEYPLQIDPNNNYIFSLLGPPWPYWIDTYVIKIDFMAGNELLGQKVSYSGYQYDIPPRERYFLSGSIPEGATRAVVWSETNGTAFKLYEVDIATSQRVSPVQPLSINFNLTCGYDAVFQNADTLLIDPSIVTVPGEEHYYNTQGRIMLTLNQPISRIANKYFGIHVTPQQNVTSLEVMVFDDKDVVASQYYIALKGGVDNLLILNWLGFNNIEALSDTIKEIQIKIHTDTTANSYTMKVGDILTFRDNSAVKYYLDHNECYIPEKDKKI